MSATSPLLHRKIDDPIAWLSEPLKPLGELRGAVSAKQFLTHVNTMAALLPDARHVINLCDNRYLFLVSLCAVVVRGQTNLLPPNTNGLTQQDLVNRYPETVIVHDQALNQAGVTEKLHTFDVGECMLVAKNCSDTELNIPQIDHSQVAVISFTSGSTGESKPNIKTWLTLRESSLINARYMLPNQHETFYHLATVPGQHMWGLETSVLFALFANVCIADTRPFFPEDISQQLAALPRPRSLVSTPLHLRSLIAQKPNLPCLANVLCATAPLNKELATNVEKQYRTQLREIYGCSEVGSMAVRRTALTDIWQSFEGLYFTSNQNESASVSADHLPLTIHLEDSLELLGAGEFKLGARAGDQVKIAGKRGSLQQANKVLMEYQGIEDGVVIFPEQIRAVPRLVALVVFKNNGNVTALREHFRQRLDAAFVPRPIYSVSSLPREANGKLSKAKVISLYKDQLSAV